MLKKLALAAGTVLFAANLMAATPAKAPHVLLDTTNGQIEIELDPVKAPISTKNFLDYVNSGFYTNTIFHRVIPGFMAQGGGFTPQMQQKETKAPIKNEHKNGLANVRGTLSMARTSVPDSATSQFFINVKDNDFLDQGDGYAVFGKVVKGMDVVDIIVNSPTTTKQGMQNVPSDPVIIKSAKVID
ncbi:MULTISPECIES: peptidylprolyl isomerase [Pseudomonas]|jgi:peptidyl-prolyl cis-trans isomerase A (cyclophilin A)|uniref:peptidylprolyl isomerase n=1 Tax=Pseudomonas TaxID=286 RepID=UPI000597133B|nr:MULTISPECIES: peptidylprolyl isomerase [Pseudomonas]KIK86138.1 peptidylprolyl isomerase [Pseudomonas sp. W15Feb9B]MBI6946892.1 peptidylprolyl isomerase [Pseudomonas koreensis]MCU7214547.1 peptidylprolyl isomerase [Pseudomonas sp. VE 196-7]MDX9673401.1 peptidylprolyl isomerase [Pseudomonas sp. P8_250]PMQ14008.1 Peptidyl-prolyl cis-trans isomerase A [Pseudomonas sp. AD21]